MPPTNATGNGDENHGRFHERIQRQIEQQHHREQRHRDRGGQGSRGTRLALDAAAHIEEIPLRQLEDRAASVCWISFATLPRSRPVDAGLDGNPPAARFAPDGARPERLLDRGELPERNPQSLRDCR